MKISAIKQQVKRRDRYSVYGDGKYLFSFSEAELIDSGIRIGQNIDESTLEELTNKAIHDKAYDRSLNLISRRMRSEWELRDYLRRKDYDEGVQQYVVDRLAEHGYINDAEFAKRWVENRRLMKATSKRRLSQELHQKRITDELIKQALEADETDELVVLKELIERKRKQTKYKDDMKLMQYLTRQGFTYSNIKTALNSSDSE